MSAEGSPQHDASLLAVPLAAATRLVVRYPKGVLAAALVLAALSILATFQFLGFKTSRLDLLNPRSGFNQRWLAYLDEFGNQDDAVIVIEGESRAQVGPAVEELAAELAREPKLFRDLLYQRDFSRIRAKGLHLLPDEELQKLGRFIAQAEPIISGNPEHLSVGRAVQGATFCLSQSDALPAQQREAAREQLARTLTGLAGALAPQPVYQSPFSDFAAAPERLRELETDYLLSGSGQMGFVLLHLPAADGQLVGGAAAVDRLREIIRGVQARRADVQIGLTGMPILENDEMRASQTDMLQATLLSLVGVAILFLAGFGGWRHSVFAVATLLISMAWSFGFVTLVIGHLNILSSAFAAILIGLGIDFGIHYVARYLQLRRTVGDSASALEQTAKSVGPGIITGGVTTAVAFGTTALTDFVGVAELGLVAAGGLVLCIAGAFLVLPAMIQLSDRRRPGQQVPPAIPFEWLLRPIVLFPKSVLTLATVAAVILSVGVVRLRYDHNLLNLQPTRTESVEVERRLHNQSDRSVFFAVSVAASRQELRERKARFEKLGSVEWTEEIASLIPESSPAKRQAIGAIAGRLAALPDAPPALPVTPADQLATALGQLEMLLAAEGPTGELRELVGQTRASLARLPSAEAQARLDEYERRTASALHAQLALVASLADADPPSLADLPAPLAARFVGKNKKHLLRVYARGNVWDMDKLQTFVRDLESVDPQATGHPVQTYYASRQMQQSYIHAALYSLLAVAIVVMVDFRSIRYTLLALLPMALGILVMFGVLGLLDIPLNPANLIALPLILGMGLDNGVHLVHEYLQQRGRFRLTNATATALLLTSLTTMVGFGVMVFARHQGIRTLGQALTIGMFCCLATSIVMLPPILALMSWNRREAPAGEELPSPSEPTNADEMAPERLRPERGEPAVATATSSTTLRASRVLARRRRRAA